MSDKLSNEEFDGLKNLSSHTHESSMTDISRLFEKLDERLNKTIKANEAQVEQLISNLEQTIKANETQVFKKLDKRLNNTTPQNKPVRKPPGQIPPDRGSVSGSSNQIKFTQRDVNTMREYGLDPNDPAQRKEWLNNKRG